MMRQYSEINSRDHAGCMNTDERRKKILRDLFNEQRKLESMVSELFEKGNCNMGTDKRILKQSGKLDQLVVSEMMLDEMKSRI